LQYELVAEDVGDFALDRDRRTFGHLVDTGRLQKHDLLRLPILGETRTSGAECGACDQHDCKRAGRENTAARLPSARGRWKQLAVFGFLV
jgi:hypothetical protein